MKITTQGILAGLLLSLVFALSACGGSDASPVIEDGDQETTVEQADAVESEWEALDRPNDSVSGLWAMNFAIAYKTQLPVFNKPAQLILTGVARLQTTQDGNSFNFTENVCDFSMQIVEDIDFHITFSNQSIKAIPILPRAATLSGITPDSLFEAPNVLDLYGVDKSKFADPAHDPLPTDCKSWPEGCADSRVIDFEGDGRQGLTGRVQGGTGGISLTGEVYVVMRMLRQMHGKLTDINHMSGQIDSSVEMVTLSASNSKGDYNYFLDKQLPLTPITDPNLNRFEAIRLDRNLDCATLFARRAEFFSYNPMDYATPLPDNAR